MWKHTGSQLQFPESRVGGPTTKVDQNSKVEMDPRPTD